MALASPDLILGVCTRNGGGRIGPTLRSIDALRDPSGRIAGLVVVDNASTDESAARIGSSLGALRLPSRLLHEPRVGKSYALERLFAETAEPLVAIVDDDVTLHPGWASAVLACADAHPRAGAVGGLVALDLGPAPSSLAIAASEHLAGQDLGPRPHPLGEERISLVGAAILHRRAAVDACGYFARRRLECLRGVNHANGVDSECCALLRAGGWELWYTPDARAVHSIPPSRQTRDYLCRLAYSCGLGEAYLRSLLAGSPLDVAGARLMANKARHRLWKESLLRMPGARRTIRRAYARGRLAGWRELLDSIQARAV